MGYDLHLTRADEWIDSGATPITIEEWVAAGRTAPFLAESAELSDGTTNPVFVLAEGGLDGPAFYWSEGRVVVRGADEGDVPACVEVARLVSATVIGDDGETYS